LTIKTVAPLCSGFRARLTASDRLERNAMEQALEQRLREVLGDLPPEDVYAIIAFAQFLSERR